MCAWMHIYHRHSILTTKTKHLRITAHTERILSKDYSSNAWISILFDYQSRKCWKLHAVSSLHLHSCPFDFAAYVRERPPSITCLSRDTESHGRGLKTNRHVWILRSALVICLHAWRKLTYIMYDSLLSTDYLFKFLVIGNAGVGKSCLLHQFIEHKCKCKDWTMMVLSGMRRSCYWVRDCMRMSSGSGFLLMYKAVLSKCISQSCWELHLYLWITARRSLFWAFITLSFVHCRHYYWIMCCLLGNAVFLHTILC